MAVFKLHGYRAVPGLCLSSYRLKAVNGYMVPNAVYSGADVPLPWSLYRLTGGRSIAQHAHRTACLSVNGRLSYLRQPPT